VIVGVITEPTLTVIVFVELQAPTDPVHVYTEVTFGVTEVLAPVEPLDQTYVLAPLAERLAG
jgi:hypothetical protein